MNANLILRRLRMLSARQLMDALRPHHIHELLYLSKDAPKICPHRLPFSVSMKSFSIQQPSGIETIDQRLTAHRIAYVVFYGGDIIHENWISFDTLLPTQFGFDARIPVVGYGFTMPQYRGNGVCPYALSYLLNDMIDRNISRKAYTIVSSTNSASIRAVEKGGFELIAQLKGVRVLGGMFLQKSTIRFPGTVLGGASSATSRPS
jgi:RimJ/RimL family protein N-acetyltransferase